MYLLIRQWIIIYLKKKVSRRQTLILQNLSIENRDNSIYKLKPNILYVEMYEFLRLCAFFTYERLNALIFNETVMKSKTTMKR